VQRHQIRVLPASPTFLNLILVGGHHERHDMGSLRLITYGTEPMSDELLARVNRAFPGVRLLQTFGTRLVAGRYFNADEYLDFEAVQRDQKLQAKVGVIVITQALGERLWPGQSALGKTIYLGETSVRVIGVVAGLIRPALFNGDASAQWSMAFPLRMNVSNANRYVLRAAPNDRDPASRSHHERRQRFEW